MIIAIDAGNTFTKWKVFDSKQSVQESGRFHNIDGWQSPTKKASDAEHNAAEPKSETRDN